MSISCFKSETTIIEMFILFADFIFKSVFITLKVTNLELFFYHWVLALY